jgi:hypothetical protein
MATPSQTASPIGSANRQCDKERLQMSTLLARVPLFLARDSGHFFLEYINENVYI